MSSSKGDYNPEGTGGVYNLSVLIAVINLALVGLVFLVDIMLLSSGVILFFLLGFYAVYLAIRDAIEEKDKIGGLKAFAGLAINIVAVVIYVYIIKGRLLSA